MLPVAQKVKVPVVILNLQPVSQLDYEAFNKLGDRGKMTGIWLEHCQACSVPEIASVFNRSEIKYDIVTGYLQDEDAWSDIKAWTEAAAVASVMRNNRLGILGHYYNGMLDVYSDLTKQSAVFGTHIELLEMCELKKWRDKASEIEVQEKIEEFQEAFDVSPECDEIELRRAAKTSVALDQLIAKRDLGAMAYYYEGDPGMTMKILSHQ